MHCALYEQFRVQVAQKSENSPYKTKRTHFKKIPSSRSLLVSVIRSRSVQSIQNKIQFGTCANNKCGNHFGYRRSVRAARSQRICICTLRTHRPDNAFQFIIQNRNRVRTLSAAAHFSIQIVHRFFENNAVSKLKIKVKKY